MFTVVSQEQTVIQNTIQGTEEQVYGIIRDKNWVFVSLSSTSDYIVIITGMNEWTGEINNVFSY